MSYRPGFPTTLIVVPFLLFSAFLFSACTSQNVAFVENRTADEVATFRPGSGTVLGKVSVQSEVILLREDGDIGYVGESGTIRSVDLTASPPALIGAPTTVSHTTDDLAEVNPTLIVSSGRDTPGRTDALVSSVLPAAQSELDVLDLGPGNTLSVDVCDDDSTVLVAMRGSNRAVRKLEINSQGTLTDTGLSFRPDGPPANVHCAPGSETGIVISSGLAVAQTFTISGAALTPVATQQLQAGRSGWGHSAAFNSNGSAVFMMSSAGSTTGRGFVERFDFDPQAGTLGSSVNQIVAPVTSTTYGIELLDVGPGGDVYVTEWTNDRVLVLDPNTLAQQRIISGLPAPVAIDIEGT
ncbi:MAG: hypothetical protein GVY12_08110 [Bacteroidetes bacterium]|jgi:YVTN family beta-propeller protein|nr:hypothetical protein [Bacteroidota bacterium]